MANKTSREGMEGGKVRKRASCRYSGNSIPQTFWNVVGDHNTSLYYGGGIWTALLSSVVTGTLLECGSSEPHGDAWDDRMVNW